MSSFKDTTPAEGMATESDGPSFTQIEAFLQPLIGPVITLASGTAAAELAQNFPGINMPQSTIAYIFLTTVAAVAAIIVKRMHSQDVKLGIDATERLSLRRAEVDRQRGTLTESLALPMQVGTIDDSRLAEAEARVKSLEEAVSNLISRNPETEELADGLRAMLADHSEEITKLVESRIDALEEHLPAAARQALSEINLGELFRSHPAPVSEPEQPHVPIEPPVAVAEPEPPAPGPAPAPTAEHPAPSPAAVRVPPQR